jgi:PD-(D/E)XK nuclease superfamily
VFRLLELSKSEHAADQTLAFFLDPRERHGMGGALVDTLLSLLGDGPVLNADGRIPESRFACEKILGSSEWRVERQVAVSAPELALSALNWPGIMDLYLTNKTLSTAVVIENKIDAPLNNPLESYVRHAVDEGYSTVLLAVLAPYELTFDDEHARWATRGITYRALFERMWETSALSDSPPGDSNLDVRRSIDLIQQFREIRERGAKTMGYTNDADFVNEFRQMLSGHEPAVEEFFDAVQTMNQLCRVRSGDLEPVIRERLDTLGVDIDWEAHGGSNNKGWVTAWNAYHLVESDNSIELIMTPDPRRAGPITAKAYPGRTYKYYPDFDHITFGVDWHASDEEVAEAFIVVVRRLLQEHPARS